MEAEMIHRWICWVWATAAILWAMPAGAAPLRVTLETDAVAIAGTTPRGQVVLLGVTREIGEDDFHTVRRHLQTLSDEDGDGVIRYPVKEGVPLRSLWAVADLTSGDYDAVAPTGFAGREVGWRGRGLERRHDGKDAVEDRRALLELLVVRPKVGAWALRLGDGDENDADGSIDGRIEGILEQMLPLTGDLKPPAIFQRDDLVMALDPTTMEITLVKVPAGR
jgi:hypothetical protein